MENEHELFRHLRGIRKIAINCKHGGFGISREAELLYLKYAGIEYNIKEDKDTTMVKLMGHPIYTKDDEYWSGNQIDRDDPILIKVIEELGAERAGSRFCDLKIVEIPADVQWQVEEYDGMEWVAEKHRTWR